MKNNKTSEEILEHASRLIRQYGYAKTTMNDIARACGKTKTFIYHYFPNKEAILEIVINRQIDKLIGELIKAINSESNAKDKIIAYVMTRMRMVKEIASLYMSFREEYLSSHHIVEQIRHQYDMRETQIIAEILKNGSDDGVFQITDYEGVAQAFVVAMKGFEYIWATSNEELFNRDRIMSLLDVFFYGITK